MLISCGGIYLARNPASNCKTFAFGVVVFFLGFIPLISSTVSLNGMRSISSDELLDICDGGTLLMDKYDN